MANPFATRTAIEVLKMLGPQSAHLIDLGGLLRKLVADKGIEERAVVTLSRFRFFGALINDLLMRNGPAKQRREENSPRRTGDTRFISTAINRAGLINQLGSSLNLLQPAEVSGYRGLHMQNFAIDRALAGNGTSTPNNYFGEGAASHFNVTVDGADLPYKLLAVPIGIMGYGAAGIMVGHALDRLGFNNVTVFEKAEKLGIWRQDNVARLSRNNPRLLEFYGVNLHPAPGGGIEVRNFLESLPQYGGFRTATVASVVPGKLNHRVRTSGGDDYEFPILINTMGIGKPKPVSDPRRMVTSVSTAGAGIRWQQELEQEGAKGKRFILIGLGNSTAEMLRQIHDLIDQGYEVDYRILTHYPKDAVWNPDVYVPGRGDKTYRVFRDISRPNLVDFQGDLAPSRHDYYRALMSNKIIHGVTRWEVADRRILVFGPTGKPIRHLRHDHLYTLIGYRQPEDVMTSMGCTYDRENECVLFDFDGEFIADPTATDPVARLHKGYFGFGSVLETPFNPNAIVIPGMLHRIGDLLFTVIMRAAEYAKLGR